MRLQVTYFRFAKALSICLAIASIGFADRNAAADELHQVTATLVDEVQPFLKQYCFDCHGPDQASAAVNFERLLSELNVNAQFKSWEKVAHVLGSHTMPPKEAEQPPNAEREKLAKVIRATIDETIRRNAGDPGPQVLRRLTSAEFGATIHDLTGLELGIERTFVNDAVGGEGFTNAGNAQFMEDAALERYLESAKTIAEHAIIGAGPLSFYIDPGATGRELSAIHRIATIYRQHGFRTGAGEGAEPFGLDLYPRAFFVAWQFANRHQLGRGEASLEDFARENHLSERFCNHVWQALSQPADEFPLSMIAKGWRDLPQPNSNATVESLVSAVRAKCDRLAQELREWQSVLAASAGDEEEAAVLTAGDIHVEPEHTFRADLNWPKGAKSARFELTVSTASQQPSTGCFVIWRNPMIRFRTEDNRRGAEQPLADFLTRESIEILSMGKHPAKTVTEALGKNDFVMKGDQSIALDLNLPPGVLSAQLTVRVELDVARGENRIVRCRIADGKVEGETAAEFGASSTLLADLKSPMFERWRSEVASFARMLPQVSHREPAPSDRDPIPPPFDNAYNRPERNHFHTAIKYYRDDRFLVEHILDDATRTRLDEAWTDLLTSFDYHAQNLNFISGKFGLENRLTPQTWSDREFQSLEPDVRRIAMHLRDEHAAMQAALRTAKSRHVEDVIRFAQLAWRRTLDSSDTHRLKSFYISLMNDEARDHEKAIRSLIARVLASPEFLYKTERGGEATPTLPSVDSDRVVRVSDRELANRLSYFLWSSVPDRELLEQVESGNLREPDVLTAQVRRMLHDAKARRLATEFFGQWLGFYRFDDFRGIDVSRFPEFDEQLRHHMYDEAISFFEYIIRHDRPVSEILFGDYSFANTRLARHYGLSDEGIADGALVKVANLRQNHRGGVLGLGALHAVTSAPLRTSAVKRGDWVLRRLLGTPVPPPPADAGSIAADDVQADRLTVRQRLEAHRTSAVCANCHSRIDPLGFALENFDPIGRWRETYRDGQKIDAEGTLSDGTNVNGLEGLQNYLDRQQSQFHRTLATKLLGYALGRAELVTDQPLIDRMQENLQGSGTIAEVVQLIATSQQFNYRRSGDKP